jgi:hypothetical protein
MGLFGVLRNGRATTAGGFQQLCDTQATANPMRNAGGEPQHYSGVSILFIRAYGIEAMNAAGRML